MKRAQMIAKGTAAVEATPGRYGSNHGYDCCQVDWGDNAEAVIDAILPQVTTVEELGALPFAAKLIDEDGHLWWRPSGQPLSEWPWLRTDADRWDHRVDDVL